MFRGHYEGVESFEGRTMLRLATAGMIGAAAVVGFVGVSNASDEFVVARLTIESVGETASGYAPGPARSIDLGRLLDGIPAESAPVMPQPETASAPVAPAVQDEDVLASAATVLPTARPDFESMKSLTPETAPVKRAAQPSERQERKVVKVDVDGKRVVKIPMPVAIGVFR